MKFLSCVISLQTTPRCAASNGLLTTDVNRSWLVKLDKTRNLHEDDVGRSQCSKCQISWCDRTAHIWEFCH